MLKLILAIALVFGALSSSADPMRPPGFGAVSTKKSYRSTQYNVSQILVAGNRKRAVINQKLVMLGDRVDGAKVARIDLDKVTLIVAGKRKELAVNKASGLKIKRETK
jgi:hypothetical protein